MCMDAFGLHLLRVSPPAHMVMLASGACPCLLRPFLVCWDRACGLAICSSTTDRSSDPSLES